jgi:tryptophanyl-tRNA synthetase
MSKSYNNTISLGEEPEAVRKKVMNMKTDPARIRKDDPGHPDICTVFAYQKLFNTVEKVEEVEQACKAGKIGCVQCKRALHEKVAEWHTPIYDKRTDLLTHHRPYLRDLLEKGSVKARSIASTTMQEVLQAMHIDY